MPEQVLIYSRFPKAMMVRIGERFELLDAGGKPPTEVFTAEQLSGIRAMITAGHRARMIQVAAQLGIADLLIVNGNPLDNLRLLNPYGADVMMINGREASNYSPLGPNDKVQSAHGGGIEWTIKDGIPYHVPTLMREVREMVSRARAQRVHTTAGQP